MATSASLASNFAGTWSKDYYIKQILELNTLQNVTVFEGVVKQLSMPNLSFTGGLTAETCDFTPTGTVTAADRVLTLKGLSKDVRLCYKDMRALWDALEAGGSFQNQNAPAVFQAALIDLLGRTVRNEIETMIWQGDGTTDQFTGFLTAFALDANVVDVSAATTLTKTNIVAEVERGLTETLAAVTDQTEKPRIYMSPSTARLFAYSQQALGYLDKFNADNPIPFIFAGEFEIAQCNGIPANNYVIARPDNLAVGFGDSGDVDNIRIIDFRDTTGDRAVGMSTTLGVGVQYRLGTEITWYNGNAS